MPDLGQWQLWSQRQHRAERAARRVTALPRRRGRSSQSTDVLLLPSGTARSLVVLDHFSPSCHAAIVEPLSHLDPTTTAVVTAAGSPADVVPEGGSRTEYRGPDALPRSITAVLSLGGYLRLSEPVVDWAQQHDIPFVVVQHGLLTPWSPPAPQGARVLAWSESDADFWAAGRPDVTTCVVGSQLLWNATTSVPTQTVDDRPVVLGQLHGSELARRETFFTYWEFCRAVPSDYRPHPNERDAASRGMHDVMRRGGISFETSERPLAQLRRPVVSIFSTGTLEAAQHGLPAWVFHPDPPPWVRAFWDRYGLAQYGSRPTRAWPMHDGEPAARVAAAIGELS